MYKLSNLLLACVLAFSVNAQENAGLRLPAGFSATLFADQIGTARHIAINDKGILFAKLNNTNKAGQSIVRMEDANGDGVAEKISGWGKYGGTGIYVKGSQLYASSDDAVYLYQLDANGEVINPTSPKTIIQNLHSRRQHASKSITLDPKGNIYVNIGAYSNACQEKDRSVGSKGMMPCPILDSAGGIWKFDGSKENQSYAEGKRYATGLRNVIGLDWNNTTNSLFVTQHGRDQLNTFYPTMYTDAQNAELPAETMKHNEIQLYKNIGTIQRSKDEDGKIVYLYTHNFFGQECDDSTIKGAKEMLDYYEAKAVAIKDAIRVLRGSGYKVYKELDRFI